ncbi:MAG: helix-turn-helix domain-containing protein [Cyanobacteria bacterium SZAS TMP-1]|nr:helix-turn-helix domain-containing protein [Cyanobacteria bacterium SZAS TMP-1]
MKLIGKKYKKLIERFPLQKIESDEDLYAADEIADELYERLESLDADERAYLEVLTILIGIYENTTEQAQFEQIGAIDSLKFLMQENGLKQADLTNILGISSGNASEIMNGKRTLTKGHIAKLSEFFSVSANAFLTLEKSRGEPQRASTGNRIVAEEATSDKTFKSRRGK